MTTLSPFGERSLTLVAADFDDRASALAAASTLPDEEVSVIAPGDPLVASKLEPDQRGIWRTMIRSHLILGVAGALVGLAASWALTANWAAAAGSPGFTALFAGVMGAFAGMIIAGALTLRPDHGLVIRRVHAALRRGRWAVVVRPLDAAHTQATLSALRAAGAHPMRSF